MLARRLRSLLLVLITLVPLLARAGSPLPVVSPEEAGMSSERLSLAGRLIEDAIARKETPGAVLLVGRKGRIVFRQAYGRRAVEPVAEPMTVNTVFDLASLTKVVATATSILTLVDSGSVRLSEPVVRLLPDFGAGGGLRDEVTIEQLLLHRAGLEPSDPMDLYLGTPAEIFARKYRRPLIAPPGSRFIYSDTGYEVLGELVRKMTGKPIDVYARERIFAPLGMKDTEYRPILKGVGTGQVAASRIAPTEMKDARYLRGEVHDPRAHALGGISGHAGLFSSADDLAVYCNMILSGGGPVLSPSAIAAMTRPRFAGDRDLRGLGWDIATAYSTNRGDLFPIGSFGHTGWTGTSFWLDPASGVFVILLANRNHPEGGGNLIPLRSRVATVVASAVTDVSVEEIRKASDSLFALPGLGEGLSRLATRMLEAGAPDTPPPSLPYNVVPGLEVLEEKGFASLTSKRVGILTNRTGRTRDGRSTVEVLRSPAAQKKGIRVVRLFAAEHGPGIDREDAVPDSMERLSSLPIRSLYGASPGSRRPREEDLADLDAVVVDLQDAGARFFTSLATLSYMIDAAEKAGIEIVVLDRPNPIGADIVEGPVTDTDKISFTAFHPVSIRTGMTIGELAQLYRAERAPGARLSVIPMRGYQRSLWYDETGLPWIDPSPNLQSLLAVALYPGISLLEVTNVSVGRGTKFPFEVVGAPWMDGVTLARTLNARSIKGVRFVPVEFTPASSTYAGQSCRGIRISVVDRHALRPVALGLEIATALRDRHPREWSREKLGALLASSGALSRFDRGELASQIATGWAADQMDFERRRAPYLIYGVPSRPAP
ncbi:MAG: DUF1343 domain-containing protein [Acidobacteria bacterium]|nr:DUF1343 domain-containing protein [Acidobacteriota bacterium]